MGLRLDGTICSSCTAAMIAPKICLRCDSDPNICENEHTPLECGVDKCKPGFCDANKIDCNVGGCEDGYYVGLSSFK